jgi:hypothetical protein
VCREDVRDAYKNEKFPATFTEKLYSLAPKQYVNHKHTVDLESLYFAVEARIASLQPGIRLLDL